MTTYHEGEIAVQERLGVRKKAERVGAGVHESIPPPARAFLETQTTAVVAVISDGRPVVIPLTGSPGFVHAESESVIRFRDAFAAKLAIPLEADALIGSIIIDFEGRRRMRANGRGWRDGDDLMMVTTEVYSNCPRFITPRCWSPAASSTASPAAAERLTSEQTSWITSADTFFIGTFHAGRGADASHRGGDAGFVSVVDPHTLSWPDFAGNNMLNTLGNLEVEPRAAIAFIDFATGGVLQLAGTSRIRIDPTSGKRTMRFEIESVVETPGALAARWTLVSSRDHC